MTDQTSTSRTTVTTETPLNGPAPTPDPSTGYRTIAVMSAPIVKAVACAALGAMGVASVVTGHDGATLNLIVSAILVVTGMSAATQALALTRRP
jgi:hypothetical protein